MLSIGAVSSLVYGIIEAPAAGWTDLLHPRLLRHRGHARVAFAWRETHTAAPMLDLALFRDRRFTAGAGAISLTFFAMFGMIFGLTQFLQFVLGKTALEAGTLMISLALGIPLGARISLKATEHAASRGVISTALIGVAACSC